MSNQELYHHGVKGQRWGFRRYQNPDGTLTARGRKRALKLQGEYSKLTGGKKMHKARVNKEEVKEEETKPKTKKLSEMSDAELSARIERLKLEAKYQEYITPQTTKKSDSFVKSIAKDVLLPAAKSAAKDQLTAYANKEFKKMLGLNEPEKEKTSAQYAKDWIALKSIKEAKANLGVDDSITLEEYLKDLKL